MGTTASRAELLEPVINNHSKEYETSSFDAEDGLGHDRVMEKKTLECMSTTPRTKPAKNGYGVKSKVDRQIKGQVDRRDDITPPSHKAEDQVHVNLAMADLMAYLQVVANNSNNLPLTRRDDPELSRMVSNLTSEEYARKSAAFIPADVRVIGGTFLKYGRVWDLPTSDEYNATDGAQEPGRSYGGACSNALLKVLYDAANDAVDAAQTMEATDALFDDDEDEKTLGDAPDFTRNSTFASIDMNEHSNPSVISWSTLLRTMKAEMKEIEFAQAPMITATRKFDLNQPFSLVPESFNKETGKKRSLLIGCNYSHLDGHQLKAAHDDVRSMKDYIVNVHGFPEDNGLMTILLDDDEHKHPTFMNITEAFKALSEQSLPGDAVFIQFSGHGGRVLDALIDAEAESYDEVIVPSNYTNSGLIRDKLIFKTLLAPMRYGVTVTIVIDCCDTGMILELPYSWSTRKDRPETVAKMAQNDDFSFVRFLKVIKTLYESSTFTQLGRNLGSALNIQPFGAPKPMIEEEEEEEDTFHSRCEDEARAGAELPPSPQSSRLMNIFGACTSPLPDVEPETRQIDAMVGTTGDSNAGSLLDQVLNWTLGQGEEGSDEDSYKSHNSYDDIEDSFDDTDDDGYERSKRGRSRRRQR